jgi:hypothetical protein
MRIRTAPKYHNRKAMVDGIRFDSQREAKRYQELRLLERAGKITNLKVHPEYQIFVKGDRVCKYVADFSYNICDRYLGLPGSEVVEDVKGVRTEAYRLKKRLMKAAHGIEIVEV